MQLFAAANTAYQVLDTFTEAVADTAEYDEKQ
jgi:hypothetical protein